MPMNISSDFLSIKRILLLVAAMIFIPLILDQVVLRGFYLSYLEPESTAGMTLLARSIQEADYASGKKNVLILGDSRIGEGFSAGVANRIGHPMGFNFVGLGLPGTTPRAWYYILRDLDAQRNKYHAIYIMSNTFRDDDVYEDIANRSIDTAYVAPVLNFLDILSYPQSFTDPKEAMKATLAIAFPATSFKSDILGFFKAPIQRAKKAALWRAKYPSWIAAYPGHTEKLPVADTPFSTDGVLRRVDGPGRSHLDEYFRTNQSRNTAFEKPMFFYRSKWYGDIAQQYASTAVTFGTFLIPRGPYHAAMKKPAEAQGALKLLEQKGTIKVLNTAVSLPLEEPEFFFDHLHMNSAGRQVFSGKLADAIITQLKG